MPLLGTFIVPHPPLIVPEIGRGEQVKIQKTIDSYQEIARRIAFQKPETIVLITPHSILYSDYLHLSPGISAEGSFKDFGASKIKMSVSYDVELTEAIAKNALTNTIPAGTLGERSKQLDHATMVPLYFIHQVYTNFQLVRISISGLSPLTHYRFGKCLAEAIEKSGKNVVIVSSGDCSHKLKEEGPYGLSKEGPIFDNEITKAMASADFMRFMTFEESFCEAAAECGLRSFIIMAGALDGKAVSSELLSYEGPFGVGYAVAAYTILGDDETRRFDQVYEANELANSIKRKQSEDAYVRLARASLEHFVTFKKRIRRPDSLPEELTNHRAGVFVSLHKEGRLRGCIGTIEPTAPSIAEEIIRNAISAGTQDPRFDPIREEELSFLEYSVDVLFPAEPIMSQSELDVLRYGVIVRKGHRTGLLLPNLDGIQTSKQQVDIALQKAGIEADEEYTMERFEVIRHH